MGLVKRSSVVAAAIWTAGWSSRNKRSTLPMSCGVAATERKCAHSSRFHQRADRLLVRTTRAHHWYANTRSEEHTSELQSRLHLVCRLLLEKKKNKDHHD